METFLMQIFNGISVSSIFLLASLGLAITFGLMGVKIGRASCRERV